MKRLHSVKSIVLTVVFMVLLPLIGLAATKFYTLPVSVWPTVFRWPSQYDNRGVPKFANISTTRYYNDSSAITPEQSASFIGYINAILPERYNQSNNTSLLSGTDDQFNIYINKPAKVEITFVYEGAGYVNSLGYFTFDPLNLPSRTNSLQVFLDKIIFPNASFYNSGGTVNGMYTWDTVNLGVFTPPAGGSLGIGFTLVANGFQYSATNGGVAAYPSPTGIFYSLSSLNPETPTAAKPLINRHMVLIKDPGSGLIALGMEDINRTSTGCDHDFNDVLYRIKVSPEDAITNLNKIYSQLPPDDDSDGVPNYLDEFPQDGNRASSTWYPSKTTWNMLAFEDLWPQKGDYDMNDMIVRYRYRHILKSDGTIKEVQLYYQLAAMGASLHNGFGVELTGVPKTTTYTATKIVNSGSPSNLTHVDTVNGSPASNLVFRIFNDAYLEYGFTANDTKTFVNTYKNSPISKDPKTGAILKNDVNYQVNIVFTSTIAANTLKHPAPYNPFLFRTLSLDLEVHLPGYAPTTKATEAYFRRNGSDDNSSTASSRYYVTNTGYPWALNIPSGWKWPTETNDIVKAYPQFKTWAESGGTSQTSWYLSPSTNSSYIY